MNQEVIRALTSSCHLGYSKQEIQNQSDKQSNGVIDILIQQQDAIIDLYNCELGFAITKADEATGARNSGIPDLNDLFKCRSFRVSGNELLGRQPQDKYSQINNWVKYKVGQDKTPVGPSAVFNSCVGDVTAVSKDLSMLTQNTFDMYNVNGGIVAGENNYGFVKLREIIQEINTGIRYFDLRHGNIQIQLTTNAESDVYACVLATASQGKQGVQPYTINDLCLFRKMYKLNNNVSPTESMALTATPQVHETWVQDRFALASYVSHKTTLPCSFVKYAVLSIQPTTMDLTLATVDIGSLISFTKAAQDVYTNGYVKKLHDSVGFQCRSMFTEIGGVKYPMLELVRNKQDASYYQTLHALEVCGKKLAIQKDQFLVNSHFYVIPMNTDGLDSQMQELGSVSTVTVDFGDANPKTASGHTAITPNINTYTANIWYCCQQAVVGGQVHRDLRKLQ